MTHSGPANCQADQNRARGSLEDSEALIHRAPLRALASKSLANWRHVVVARRQPFWPVGDDPCRRISDSCGLSANAPNPFNSAANCLLDAVASRPAWAACDTLAHASKVASFELTNVHTTGYITEQSSFSGDAVGSELQ
jgi:hypothetical protein